MHAKSFPTKLYVLLETEDPEIIRWIRNGFAFKVFDIKRFQELILPHYYRHGKVESFQRQLNLYGFKRVNRGDDMGAYYHPLLVQGRKDWAKRVSKDALSPAMRREVAEYARIRGGDLHNAEDSASDDDEKHSHANLPPPIATRRPSILQQRLIGKLPSIGAPVKAIEVMPLQLVQQPIKMELLQEEDHYSKNQLVEAIGSDLDFDFFFDVLSGFTEQDANNGSEKNLMITPSDDLADAEFLQLFL